MSDPTETLAKYEAWSECEDRCDDPSQHHFYVNGGGFVWRWPRLFIYKPADTRLRVGWNRYPHNIIGIAAVAFGRCWSVTWKGSPRRPGGSR